MISICTMKMAREFQMKQESAGKLIQSKKYHIEKYPMQTDAEKNIETKIYSILPKRFHYNH